MSFVRDLRVAAHSLIRTPGLAIAVVLTLSLGIGQPREVQAGVVGGRKRRSSMTA
jgi:hypothetical protein